MSCKRKVINKVIKILCADKFSENYTKMSHQMTKFSACILLDVGDDDLTGHSHGGSCPIG